MPLKQGYTVESQIRGTDVSTFVVPVYPHL